MNTMLMTLLMVGALVFWTIKRGLTIVIFTAAILIAAVPSLIAGSTRVVDYCEKKIMEAVYA